jgi:hypothetical protein
VRYADYVNSGNNLRIWNSYGSEHSANLVMVGRLTCRLSTDQSRLSFTAVDERRRRSGRRSVVALTLCEKFPPPPSRTWGNNHVSMFRNGFKYGCYPALFC